MAINCKIDYINNGSRWIMYNEEPACEKIKQHRWVVLLGGFLLSLMGDMSYA